MEGIPDITDAIICGVIANVIADVVIHQYRRHIDMASKETNPCQARALRVRAVRIKWKVYKEAHEKTAGVIG